MDITKTRDEKQIFEIVKQSCKNFGIKDTDEFSYHKLYDALIKIPNGLTIYAMVRGFIRPVLANDITFGEMLDTLAKCWSHRIINYKDDTFVAPQVNFNQELSNINYHNAIVNELRAYQIKYLSQPWSDKLHEKGHRYVDGIKDIFDKYFKLLGMPLYKDAKLQSVFSKIRHWYSGLNANTFPKVTDNLRYTIDYDNFTWYQQEISDLLIVDSHRILTADGQISYIMPIDMNCWYSKYETHNNYHLNIADFNLPVLNQAIINQLGVTPDVVEAIASPYDQYRGYVVITSRQKLDNKKLSNIIKIELGCAYTKIHENKPKLWPLSMDLIGADASHFVFPEDKCWTLDN